MPRHTHLIFSLKNVQTLRNNFLKVENTHRELIHCKYRHYRPSNNYQLISYCITETTITYNITYTIHENLIYKCTCHYNLCPCNIHIHIHVPTYTCTYTCTYSVPIHVPIHLPIHVPILYLRS